MLAVVAGSRGLVGVWLVGPQLATVRLDIGLSYQLYSAQQLSAPIFSHGVVLFHRQPSVGY